MYATKDHDLMMNINVSGYKMQLVMGGHSRSRVYDRSKSNVNEVFYRLAYLLETEQISEYISFDVKIGETCVIYDGDTGFSYALAVCEKEIFVQTVYYPQNTCDHFTARQSEFCVFVQKAEVLCADVYGKVQTTIDYLYQNKMSFDAMKYQTH